MGGTAAGGYFEVARDTLLALPNPGYVQTEDGARASLDEFKRLARERGHRHSLIVLVDRVVSQDAGSRRVWSDHMDPGSFCSLALVTSSMLGRAIGSFFLGLRKPAIPTAMFRGLDEAIAWTAEQNQTRGGPIE